MKNNTESNYVKAIYRAREIFASYDTKKMIEKYQLDHDDEYLYLTYLNTDVRIQRLTGLLETAEADTEGKLLWHESKDFGTVFTIYDLLCLSADQPMLPFTNHWQRIENFTVTGSTPTAKTFTSPYERKFSGHGTVLKQACEVLGAVFLERYAGADMSVEFPVLPYFSVRMQYWEADDEFPAQIVFLWNQVSLSYLRYETSYYLQGDILARLERLFDRLLEQGE